MATAFNHLSLVSDSVRRAVSAHHLTQASVKAWKATPERQEIKDALKKGLFLIVQPVTGTKSFQFRGRVAGQPKKITLGQFPAMSLSEARDSVDQIKVARAKGQTLTVLRVVGAAPAEPELSKVTVTEAFDTYVASGLKKRGKPLKPSSLREKKRVFEQNIKPHVGDMAFQSVTRADLARVVAIKLKEGKATASNHVHAELSVLWNWAVKHGCEQLGLVGDSVTGMVANPMSQVAKLATANVRERYLDEREIRWFLKSVHAAAAPMRADDPRHAGDKYARIYEGLLRLVLRSSDLHRLEVGEVQDDDLVLNDTKNGFEHVVWLHPSAKRLFDGLLDGKVSRELVFDVWPSNAAIERVRKAMQRLAALEGEIVPHWTLHDLRRTATTHMASFRNPETHQQLILPMIRDRVLAHKEAGVIRHYDKFDYYAEKREAIRLWNEYLDGLLTP